MKKTLTLPFPVIAINPRVILLLILLLIALPLLYYNLPIGQDWIQHFLPAALAMLHGESPYEHGFYNAPWTLLPFLPLAPLPYPLGRLAIFLMGLSGFYFIAAKLSTGPLRLSDTL